MKTLQLETIYWSKGHMTGTSLEDALLTRKSSTFLFKWHPKQKTVSTFFVKVDYTKKWYVTSVYEWDKETKKAITSFPATQRKDILFEKLKSEMNKKGFMTQRKKRWGPILKAITKKIVTSKLRVHKSPSRSSVVSKTSAHKSTSVPHKVTIHRSTHKVVAKK